MTENSKATEQESSKNKISLKEAIQKQLEAKKSKAANNSAKGIAAKSAKKMQSQQARKVSSARRKMGS